MLGSTWMHNHEILFDIKNKKIAFATSDCAGSYIIDYNYKDSNIKKPIVFDIKFIVLSSCISLILILLFLYMRVRSKRKANNLYCKIYFNLDVQTANVVNADF